MPIAALNYPDNKWYRAKIKKIIPKTLKAIVLFVDFGNEEELGYLIKEYFVTTFKCKLYDIDFLNEDGYIKSLNYVYDSIKQICQNNQKSILVTVKTQ